MLGIMDRLGWGSWSITGQHIALSWTEISNGLNVMRINLEGWEGETVKVMSDAFSWGLNHGSKEGAPRAPVDMLIEDLPF